MNRALLYSKCNEATRSDARHIFNNFLRLIRWRPDGNDTVLDVGCGPGDITTTMLLPLLPSNVSKLIGADISEEMVEFAKSQNRNPKVDFCTLDIESTNIRPDFLGQFDHLFSFYCLHWVQNQRQAFTNMYNLLRPGGDMILTLLATYPMYNVYENMSAKVKWMEYTRDVNKFISPYHNRSDSELVLKQLLADTGFSTQVCTIAKRNYVYPDHNGFRGVICAVDPFLKSIPEEMHQDYVADVVNELRELNNIEWSDNKGTVGVSYDLGIIVANKN